ncbi:hypothetical protein [Methanoregula sp.]|uniref:hypothetical protein n=1 Tax=Methanoregula sp. TaxID=2052170 RepID=UPI003C74F274
MTEQKPLQDAGIQLSETDPIRRFFVRPVFLSLTIGIPFCIFKLIFGLMAIRENSPGIPFVPVLGWLIVTWAIADLLMNTGRSLLDLLHRQAWFEYCTIAQLGQVVGKPTVFLAIDTLISFSIICAMLWTGWITQLNPVESFLWYAATTMNLISLSLVSLYNEIQRADR